MRLLLIAEDEIAVRDALAELVGEDGAGDCNGKWWTGDPCTPDGSSAPTLNPARLDDASNEWPEISTTTIGWSIARQYSNDRLVGLDITGGR
jgi:hypothetical protein